MKKTDYQTAKMTTITKNDIEFSVNNKVFNPFGYENMDVIGTVFDHKKNKKRLIQEVLTAYPEVDGIYCEQFHDIMAFRILKNCNP